MMFYLSVLLSHPDGPEIRPNYLQLLCVLMGADTD